MPSRNPTFPSPPPPPSPPYNHHSLSSHTAHLVPPLTAAAVSFSLLLLIAALYRKLHLHRTAPAPPDNHRKLRRFSFSLLRKCTASFSPSHRLGHGGFGSVYRAVLPDEIVAVKVMESNGTIQGVREFHNELTLAARVISTVRSPYLVSILGFSTYRERKVIVYEYMSNGSLQDKLLDRKWKELLIWEKRFKIVMDTAKGLNYLHYKCGPTPVVHGDVKPSNVLLDDDFNAKLGDFGLARVLDECENEKGDEIRVMSGVIDDDCGSIRGRIEEEEDNGSIVEESESYVTIDKSPTTDSYCPVEVEVSPEDGFERASSLPESWVDKASVESGGNSGKIGKKKGCGSGREYWWWKQDNVGGSESGRVKDYVMDWIGRDVKKERIRPSCGVLIDTSNEKTEVGKIDEKKHKKKKKRWGWWSPMDEDKKGEKSRKPKEWWREEFCDEMTKKNKKKTRAKSGVGSDLWWQRDEDFLAPERKKRRKSKSSFGSIDWWLDGLSGELRSCRKSSQDCAKEDVHKSGGISSTPSMRGTVCYIAPEYGGGGQLSEKCDVYSFGVLVLVIISGRRPLQVTASPMSEFERANLVSWARQLAHSGKLLDLVDTSIESLNKEQALLCITIALLCIQRSPSKRPNMKEIVEMLTGESEPPHLPFEFSPSPPSNFPFKSRKKGR